MGNFKEISSELGRIGRGIQYSLHRGDYAEAIGRVATSPFNLMSLLNEKNKPISATHKYELKFSQYNGDRDLKMVNHGFLGLVSAATSLRASAINYVFDLQRKGENTDAARFQNRLILAQIEAFYSLNPGETLIMLMPHGLKVAQGVAIIQGTRTADGVKAESHLLAEMNDDQAKSLLDALVGNGEKVILKDGKEDDPLWLGVKTNEKLFDFDNKQEEFKNYMVGILGKDFWKGEVPTCLDGGSCSSSTGQAVAPELKPVVVVSLAGAGGGMGGGGGGGKEIPVLSAPAFLSAVSLPTPVLSITQSVAPEVIFTTALHRTVVNNDNHVSSVLSEPVPLISAVEQNLGETAVLENIQVAEKPLFVAPAVVEPLFMPVQSGVYVTPIVYSFNTEPIVGFEKMAVKSYSETEMPVVEPISMFQNLEEKLETVKSVFKEERRQIQEASVPMIQFINTKPVADKPFNLATVKAQFAPVASKQLTVGRQVSETKELWQAETENIIIGATPIEQTFIVNQLRMTEQRPILEKAVEEFSLPLLEISADTAPMMVLRAALRSVVKVDEAYDFEMETVAVWEKEKAVDDEVVLVADQLQILAEKKVMAGVDQEQRKLFLVENFTVAHNQVTKDQNTESLQVKKIFWRIKAQELKPTEASILEFELPKDQNQRLYAFYHFLQKVVKKVLGEDSIKQRKVKVITESENLDLNLELVREIEYNLQLLRGKKHAQAFAFVN